MQGDIILAEPKAIVGFAGNVLLNKTMNQKLPDDFQHAETVLEQGFIGCGGSSSEMKKMIHLLHLPHRKESNVRNRMKFVSLARDVKRPTTKEWIKAVFDDFIELHGDHRYYADDKALVGGLRL